MKIKILLLILALTTNIVNAQDGNTCASAITVTLGNYTYGTIDGDPAPDNCAGTYSNGSNGEWYIFTPTTANNYTVSTDLSSNSGADTRFHVYTGDCSNLVCVGGDDDGGSNLLSTFTFSASANTDYYIIFDNNWESTGRDFEITEDTSVPAPVTFTTQSVSTSGTNRGVVDMNNDYLDDIVSVSSTQINLQLQTSTGFNLQNITTSSANFTPSWSMAAADFNADGYTDLLYGGGSGVTFMKSNGGMNYTEVSGSEYVFSQRSNFVDINNDGHLDAFVCHDVQPNVYYINDGSGNLTYYQTFDSGAPYVLGDDSAGGNYGSIWIDYDNDRDQDMFIAKCRGGNLTISTDEMYTNNGDGTFTENAASINLANQTQTWSAAWGDFDNDGDMDVLVGASSGSHILMKNNGAPSYNFTNVTSGSGLNALTSTSIEHVTFDFDNDGNLDLVSGGNILFGNGDMTFSLHENMLPSGGGAYGDVNNDGFIDGFNNGTLYVNNTTSNNWIKLSTVGVTSNKNGIGARVEVQTGAVTRIRDVRSGDGFRYMNSLNTHIGLGTETTINQITVYWPSGIIDTLVNPSVNQHIVLVEGSTLGLEDETLTDLIIHPNPVEDVIYMTTTENLSGKVATVFDISGKRVLNNKLTENTLNVSTLQNGIYILRLESKGKSIERNFIKK